MTPASKIWHLLTRDDRLDAVALIVLMVIGMGLEMLGVGLVIPVIAVLTQTDPAANYPVLVPLLAALGNPSQQALIVGVMLALLGVYLFKALFLSFLAWRQARLVYGLQAQLSQRLFEVYLRQPYTFHLQRNSAQLIRNVITEIGVFIGSVLNPGMGLLAEGLVLVGLGSLLLVIEPLGALIVATTLGVTGWGFLHITRNHLVRWGKARQYHEGLRFQHLQQGLGGARDVKLLGRESGFLAQYQVHNTGNARAIQYQVTLQQLPRLWLELMAVVGLASLVLILLAQGLALAAILPTLGLFAAAAFRLMPSVNRILGSVQSLRFGLPAIDTLCQEFQLNVPANPAAATQAVPFQHRLMLDRVTYTYPGAATPALKAVSITVQRGEAVGFIGPTGAGKSTLVDILLGLLTPDGGHVTVDGVDIQRRLRNWQDQIGYVPQTIFLTDDTLRRNVAFGLPAEQIDETAVWRAIKAAQLENFVHTLPAGLGTIVGERGIRLSGGQRQRIGIARALYHDPAVLVLDEATSSLDTATERGVMQAAKALQGSKTVLIVAHRHATVEHCDRLYRLEQGRIAPERSG